MRLVNWLQGVECHCDRKGIVKTIADLKIVPVKTRDDALVLFHLVKVDTAVVDVDGHEGLAEWRRWHEQERGGKTGLGGEVAEALGVCCLFRLRRESDFGVSVLEKELALFLVITDADEGFKKVWVNK